MELMNLIIRGKHKKTQTHDRLSLWSYNTQGRLAGKEYKMKKHIMDEKKCFLYLSNVLHSIRRAFIIS